MDKEYRTAMLHNDMDISRLMVYAKQIKESKLGKINKEGARTRSNEPSQLKPKKRFHNQGFYNTPRDNKSKVPTPKPQEEKGVRSYVDRPLCSKCGRRHDAKFLVGTGNFYNCGKICHMKKDFPMMKTQGGEKCSWSRKFSKPVCSYGKLILFFPIS